MPRFKPRFLIPSLLLSQHYTVCSLTALLLTGKRRRLSHATAGHLGVSVFPQQLRQGPTQSCPAGLPWHRDLQEAVSLGGMVPPHHSTQLATSDLERKGVFSENSLQYMLGGVG